MFRTWYRMVIGLIAGLLLLAVGALNLADNEVNYGKEVIQPGEACQTTRDGRTVERTYEEQRSENRRIGQLHRRRHGPHAGERRDSAGHGPHGAHRVALAGGHSARCGLADTGSPPGWWPSALFSVQPPRWSSR